MVQLAYAIGVAEPVSVLIDTFDTGVIDDEKISEIVRGQFKLTPKGIIETFDLRRPIYKKTAAFGHFGRTEPEFDGSVRTRRTHQGRRRAQECGWSEGLDSVSFTRGATIGE
jgi:S-adenosylmethionine synthetase